jgi:hypothetical protein
MNSMHSMMGGHGRTDGGAGGTAHAAAGSPDSKSPWGGAAGGQLSRDAGVDDIGRTPSGRSDSGTAPKQSVSGADSGIAPNNDDATYDDDLDLNDDTQIAADEEEGYAEEVQEPADYEDDGSSGTGSDGGDE